MYWVVDCEQYVVLLEIISLYGVTFFPGIVGGQTLRAVSPNSAHNIPEAVAILIIALLTMFIALFGYRYIHLYERFTFLPVIIIFIVSLGLAARYFTEPDLGFGVG